MTTEVGIDRFGSEESDDSTEHKAYDWGVPVTTALQEYQDEMTLAPSQENGLGGLASVRLLVSAQEVAPTAVATRTWPVTAPLGDLRTLLSQTLSTPPHTITMTANQREITDTMCLLDIGVAASSSVAVYVTCTAPVLGSALHTLTHTHRTPHSADIITVHLYDNRGNHRSVVVELAWQCQPKPWLGGLLHRNSGRHFHHAATQTFDRVNSINSIKQGQKTEFKRGLDEHKILCRAKIRLPEAVHLVEDLQCEKEDVVIVLCGTRELEHKTQDEISLQFEALIHTVKNKSKNAIITSILPRRNDVNLNPQILITNEKVKDICAGKGVIYLDLMSHYTGQNYLFKKDGIHLNKVGQAKLGGLLTIATLELTTTLEHKIGNIQNSTSILKRYPEQQQSKEKKFGQL
ncbi:GDSL lipase/esterase [Trinorchestia longiramus]|nr:GDSL lipase/esterase [Trinorchestia longiramus]